jgi:hypothetical protein
MVVIHWGMDSLTPAQRSLRARIAAHASWANTTDRARRTEAARRAALDRFDRQVDPDQALPPERAQRAAHARSAYFAALALRSARKRTLGPAEAEQLAGPLAEIRYRSDS